MPVRFQIPLAREERENAHATSTHTHTNGTSMAEGRKLHLGEQQLKTLLAPCSLLSYACFRTTLVMTQQSKVRRSRAIIWLCIVTESSRRPVCRRNPVQRYCDEWEGYVNESIQCNNRFFCERQCGTQSDRCRRNHAQEVSNTLVKDSVAIPHKIKLDFALPAFPNAACLPRV